jgi:uncharacterized protein YggE
MNQGSPNQLLVAIVGVIVISVVLGVTLVVGINSANKGGTTVIAAGSSSSAGPNLGILTNGTASVTKQPDLALISVGVDAQAPSASQAQQLLASKATKLVAEAKALGIASNDIDTAGYSISPTYLAPDYTHVSGYAASEQLSLKWHDVNTVGKALDGLVQEGDGDRIYASFTLADMSAAEAEARTLAIADAKGRAEAMAQAAGVKVGVVLRISDLSSPNIYYPNIASAAPSGQTQLPVGTITVSASVEVDYAIAT